MPGYLSFGVPSLDQLFGENSSHKKEGNIAKNESSDEQPAKLGILIPGSKDGDSLRSSVSICISGPDGTGKSILGMHLVSTYLADCQAWRDEEKERQAAEQRRVQEGGCELDKKELWALPKVLYVSTDLKSEMANKMWRSFGLDWPNRRVVPFRSELRRPRMRVGKEDLKVKLTPCLPLGEDLEGDSASETPKPLAAYLTREEQENIPPEVEVLFVDLAAVTAGDDWGFVNRLLAVLEPLGPGQPCHLLVIDSVEGFETLGGSRDAFGETQERRSRIAQVMRSAANKCHTLFIIEEPEEGKRLPEEFVTDVVIRLRSQMVKDYVRRTLEIEKARGHSHVRGQHSYMIRPGRGSTTGRQENHDEPALPFLNWPQSRAQQDDPCPPKLNRADYQSYLHVCHSLHYLNREIMTMAGKGRPATPPEHFAAFGIRYLDDMLDHGKSKSHFRRENGNDWRGLRSSTTTALVGNSDTQKSPLGWAFLARCFRAYASRFQDVLETAEEQQRENNQAFKDDLKKANVLLRLWRRRVKRREGGKKKRYPHNNLERQAEILNRLKGLSVTSERNSEPDGDYFDGQEDARPREFEKLEPHQIDLLKVAILRLGPPKPAMADEPPRPAAADEDTTKEVTEEAKAKKEGDEEAKAKNGDGLPVLLTTQDIHAEELARRFLPWLARKVPGLKELDKEKATGCLAAFRLLMEEYTICRRLEIHDLPSAVFFHIVQCAVEAAQRILYPGNLSAEGTKLLKGNKELLRLYGGEALSEQTEVRFQQSWSIRVVIEDFSILKNTYIELRDEPLLLRFLIFYLGREGVTTLLVDTQPGRPDMAMDNPLDSELRSLVYSHLCTWRFNFYGENRVAIAPIPPVSPHRPAVIRELRLGTDLAPELNATPLVVDPHFELYAGIEKGEPRPVPLQIRLFAENESFRAYIEEENEYYREWFVPVDECAPAQVIVGAPPGDYDKLRDFCYLQRDTRLDYTLIFQVDEFWYLRRKGMRRAGSFRPQWDYLNGVTSHNIEKDKSKKSKWVREWAVDPFGLYQQTELDRVVLTKKDDDPGSERQDEDYRRRQDEFKRLGYGLELPDINIEKDPHEKEAAQIDRVPFMWDFGFLLCKVRQWETCGKAELHFWNKSHPSNAPQERIRVKDVWERLPEAWRKEEESEKDGQYEKNRPRPSWREFLEACYQVARAESYHLGTSVPAFDLHAIAAQTFSCLVLEIWASEIFRRKKKEADNASPAKQEKADDTKTEKAGDANAKFIEHLHKRRWDLDDDTTKEKLIEWLGNEEYLEDLFKTWLLLVEVLDLTELAQSVRGNNLRVKDANSKAVAVRHWYKTACRATEEMSPDDPLVPVGLPGHFAVRGDWFLAVVGGSRSSRLADQALDLLSSRRANQTRLRRGLGLPVRRIKASDKLRTGLVTQEQGRGGLSGGIPLEEIKRAAHVKYERLIKLGAETGSDKCSSEFYWLWRSSLWRYYRHVKLWQDWLNHMILWWERLRYLERDAWVNGFERYDWIEQNEARGLGAVELLPPKTLSNKRKSNVREVCKTEDGATVPVDTIVNHGEEGKLLIAKGQKLQNLEDKPIKLLGAWDYFRKSCQVLREELMEATRVPERHQNDNQ